MTMEEFRRWLVGVVTFGSPCQDLSIAGKRGGIDGERSGLFFEAIRIIRKVKPSIAIWENVPGVFSSNGGRDFGSALDALADAGALDIGWTVLDAQWFGVAQRRRRVFVVADFRAQRAAQILALGKGVSWHPAQGGEAREEIAGTLGGGAAGRGGTDVARTLRARGNASHRAGCLQERDAKGADSDTKPGHLIAFANTAGATNLGIGLNGEAPPITTRNGDPGNICDPSGVRRLTPTECERLQGYPDGWTAIPGASDSARYRALGNSVAVPVVEWIARRVAAALSPDERTLLDLFSGIGGFSLAFERAGFTTVAFSEIEPFPCRVLAHHWPDVQNMGDVTEARG